MTMIIDGSTGLEFPDGTDQTSAFTGNAASITSGTLVVARGGTGASTLTANNVLLGNGTSAVQTVAPGTSGNVLTSNGTTWTSAPAAAFDAGTVMLFAQTSAPTGWTKLTNLDNYALRVVSGTASTGGSVAFTTAFASQTPSGSVSINTSGLSAGATTLSVTQIPSHTHSTSRGVLDSFGIRALTNGENDTSTTSGATGGGGSHSHSISGSATGSFTGTAINLAVQYIDVIRASKN